jgi:hypothetical protein
MNGKFYVLVVPQYTSKLKVLEFKGHQKEENTFDVEMEKFYATLTKQNHLLNMNAQSEVGIEVIKYDLENNIKSSFPSKKLYYFDDKIILTFDEPGLTHMITVDMVIKNIEYKKLNFTLEKGDGSKNKQGNSFLYENRLFRTTISPDQLNISILDLDSMNLVSTYNFYPDKEIDIKNGPIVMEGGGPAFTTDEKILKRTDQYFRRVLEGNLAISAHKIDSNQYELQVGSYDMYVTNNRSNFGPPGLSVGMGMGAGFGVGFGMGSGMGYPYGGFAGPGSFFNGFPGYYPYQTTVRQKVVYFKSLLGNSTFEHLEGNVPLTLKDKINQYEYKNFRNGLPEVMRIAPYKESLLFGYYHKPSKKFNLIQFRY